MASVWVDCGCGMVTVVKLYGDESGQGRTRCSVCGAPLVFTAPEKKKESRWVTTPREPFEGYEPIDHAANDWYTRRTG